MPLGMGRWAQRHRDTASLEERRLNGLALLRSGVSQAEVARRLGVTPVAALHWKEAAEVGGSSAFRAVPRSGRPTLVPREKLATLPDLLSKGALAYGFSTDLWTIPRIIEVTEAEWGVRYTESAMWRLLTRHGLSWQRPRRQAREKNERAVKNWRNRSWPRFEKEPDAEGPS
jgi:transposase